MSSELKLRPPEEVLKEISNEQAKQIHELYKKTYNQIKKEVNQLEVSSKGTVSEKLQIEQLKELKKKIHSEITATSKQLESTIKEGMKKTANVAIKNNLKWLEKYGLPIEEAYNYVPAEVIKSITTGQVYQGKWSLSKAIWQDVEKNQKDVEEIISIGLAQNKSSFDIAKDLEKYVNPDAKKDYDWSKTYPGVKKKVDYNALRLAKTLPSHAYQQAYSKTVDKNPFVTAVKWNIANNHKVCDICNDRATQDRYGLGKGVFPKDKVPMDHPNGQCVLSSVTVNSEDIADRLADWALGKEDKALDNWAKDLTAKDAKAANKKEKEYPKNFVEKDFEKNNYKLDKWEINDLLSKAKQYGKDLENMNEKQIQEQINFCLDWYKKDGTCAKELYYWSNVKGVKFDDDGKILSYGNASTNKIKEAVKENITNVIKKETKVKKQSKAKVANNVKEAYYNMLKSNGTKFYKNEEFLNKLMNNFNELDKKCNSDEKDALNYYTSSAYSYMNEHLREIYKTKNKKVLDSIELCKKALSKSSFNEDVYVRRGSDKTSLAGIISTITGKSLGEEKNMLNKNIKNLIGQVVEDKGFMSTTSLEDAGFSPDGVEYVIKLPKGTNAAYVAPISKYEKEQEILIQASTRFVIEDVEEKEVRGSKNLVVYMTAILQ